MAIFHVPTTGVEEWATPVATVGDLPIGIKEGEVRLTLDTKKLYEWDGLSWTDITAGGGGGASNLFEQAYAKFKLCADLSTAIDC